MQFRPRFGSKPNTTNKKHQFPAKAESFPLLCTSSTHNQVILARLQWLFSVLCCTSGHFTRAEKLGKCQKWLQLPPGLWLEEGFNKTYYTGKSGNEEILSFHFCQVPPIILGRGVATGVGQVRNGPSEKQPITKNWAFMSQFSVLFWPLEGITSFRKRCYFNQLETRKGERNKCLPMLKDKRFFSRIRQVSKTFKEFYLQNGFGFSFILIPFYFTLIQVTKIIPARSLIIKKMLRFHSHETKIPIPWLFYQKLIHFCLKFRFKELTYHSKPHLN